MKKEIALEILNKMAINVNYSKRKFKIIFYNEKVENLINKIISMNMN